jgi:DNA (cytosine-5)-methyltransferase 1
VVGDRTGLSASTDRGVRVATAQTVRRLTPRECERLQGFPDDWTLVPGLRCADSRRYGAMGNAVTVPVAEFIGLGIMSEEARRVRLG